MTITQERKFYRVQKNYKNCNMPDQWITVDEPDTLKQAQTIVQTLIENDPKEVLHRIILVLETTATIEP
jgi:hypothetical protein